MQGWVTSLRAVPSSWRDEPKLQEGLWVGRNPQGAFRPRESPETD